MISFACDNLCIEQERDTVAPLGHSRPIVGIFVFREEIGKGSRRRK